MANLHDHDRTQVLSRIGAAISEGQRDLFPPPVRSYPAEDLIMDDGTSQLTSPEESVLPEYAAELRFRRLGEAPVYMVTANGPAKFVSEVMEAATSRFLDAEER